MPDIEHNFLSRYILTDKAKEIVLERSNNGEKQSKRFEWKIAFVSVGIGYLSYKDGWIFFELKDAELVNGKLRVINEDNVIEISFDQNTSTKFNPGDRVRVWVDGILESVPPRMSPYYIELVQ